jgi:hypothetical protein
MPENADVETLKNRAITEATKYAEKAAKARVSICDYF